jgi:hypothetical protein
MRQSDSQRDSADYQALLKTCAKTIGCDGEQVSQTLESSEQATPTRIDARVKS